MAIGDEESAHPKRVSPWEELLRLEEAMNRFMDEVFGTPSLGRPLHRRREARGLASGSPWTPAVDILDRQDRIEIMVYLPGVPRESIDISIEEGVLRISGHRPEPEGVKPEEFHLCESRYGPFLRTVRLPNNVNLARVDAVLKDGVLLVTIPKVTAKETRRIEVKLG
jgi:HSP20 family protein